MANLTYPPEKILSPGKSELKNTVLTRVKNLGQGAYLLSRRGAHDRCVDKVADIGAVGSAEGAAGDNKAGDAGKGDVGDVVNALVAGVAVLFSSHSDDLGT